MARAMVLAVIPLLVLFGQTTIAQGQTKHFILTVMHTNDCEARIQQTNENGGTCSKSVAAEGECFGGVSRRMTKIRELRNRYPNSILLDAGGQFQGTLWFELFGGKATAFFMKELGYNAMALGNHEFDNGVKALVENFLKRVTTGKNKFPVLACNIDASGEPTLKQFIQPSAVLDVHGHKIGVVGYITQDTPSVSNTGKKLKFKDEVESIRTEVAKLKAKGINKIIALGHSGHLKDREIAKEVKGVDLVIGGHSETFLYTGEPPSNDKSVGPYPVLVKQSDGTVVPVVQAYAFGKYLGFIQIGFDEKGDVISWSGNPILLDSSVEQDQIVQDEVIERRKDILVQRERVIGNSKVFLDGKRLHCRLKECNLGNFLTDAMVQQNHQHPDDSRWTKAEIAIVNAGGIRDSIAEGDVTMEEVLAVWPYGNVMGVVELKGKTLKAALEHSVKRWNPHNPTGEFLQVSGLKVVYDVKKPAGQRVVSVQVKVRCHKTKCAKDKYQKLNDNEVYQVVMQNFLVNGGDGFTMIRDDKISWHLNGDLDNDVLVAYFKRMQPVDIGLEGRIKVIH